MTYFFSNPMVRKWKILFWLSFLGNVVLAVALVFIYKENQVAVKTQAVEIKTETKQAMVPAAIPIEVPDNTALSAAQKDSATTKTEQQAVSAETPVAIKPGAVIPVTITISDNFFSAFADNPAIADLSKTLGIENLSDLLSAHIARNLVWDLVLRKDIRKGDSLSFLFRTIPPEEAKTRSDMPDLLEIIAIQYFSNRLNRSIELYHFKPDKRKFARYYYAEGRSVEKEIKISPIIDYIQVTSLLNDRSPKHEGIDFKSPTGTPVFATVEGKVLRTNWNWRLNGNCVEIQSKRGPQVFKYLHLNETLAKAGQSVKPGDRIGSSGNTGKTTAPHLHYQINIGEKGKPVDPFTYHETQYEMLKDIDLKKFEELVSGYRQMLKKSAKTL